MHRTIRSAFEEGQLVRAHQKRQGRLHLRSANVERNAEQEWFPRSLRVLAKVVLREARERGVTIAAAESCTGGLVGATLTEIADSSDVFLGSAVCYSNEAKRDILSVPDALFAISGAVSPECAAAMARGAAKRFKSSIALAVTGIAGPGGGSEEKPVGTVWFGISDQFGERVFIRHFHGSRSTIRVCATREALSLLRRALSEGICHE